MNRKDTQKNPLNKKIEENSESNSMNSLMEINITKNISQKEKEKETESMNNLISKESEQIKSSEKSKSNIQEKKPKTSKRHRRGKSISDPRDFKCPECQRTYLSASALKNHRRMKHNFGIENEKKGRGRPKKEFFEEEYMNQMKKDYEREGFHLQRLYKRRIKDVNGVYHTTMGKIMAPIRKPFKPSDMPPGPTPENPWEWDDLDD